MAYRQKYIRGKEKIEKQYNWRLAALKTIKVYKEAIND
jgi:hypothetical protein